MSVTCRWNNVARPSGCHINVTWPWYQKTLLGDHCPRDRCENINPVDRATCADFSGLKGVGKNECEIAGCCFDSYASECYDSSPKSRDPYPNTGECQVESEKRETCGFGLSKSDCAEMTGK